ncbi:MAG: response regulator [Ktedonobacterales bacterium]|nr:response regulator [Ktedonobacterales bacterium]
MIRICLADDDAGIRASLRFFLADEGYLVEEARDGVETLALLTQVPAPRVLLLDRMMPRLDGYEVLMALQRQPELAARTAVIFMTARREPSAPAQAALLRAVGAVVVAKPYDLDDLAAVIVAAWARVAAEEGPDGPAR